jgi:hypothetical protein
MLGDLLELIDQPGAVEAALVEAGDLALLAVLADAAAALDLSTGAFAALAVRRFVERAEDEEWLELVGAIGRAADPGLAALRAIMRRAAADARAVAA